MPLSTHNAFTIAFLAGIVPAVTLLYFTLKNYEKYINDKFMFFSILTALFLGILVSFFHLIISVEPSLTSSLMAFGLIILSFAIFENLVKVVFVQLKRFEAKYDVTYYGATFGIIIGASITMGRTYYFFVRDLQWFEIAGVFMFAIAIIFMNGAAGAWLGFGLFKRDLKWTFVTVLLVSLPFDVLLFLWYIFPLLFGPAAGDLSLIGLAMVYGIAVFLYAYFKIMPEALPLKYKRERLKDARKVYTESKKE